MKKPLIAAALALSVSLPGVASAKLLDCPLRDAPFTVDSPLLDVFLSEQAMAAINGVKPGIFDGLPPMMKGTKAPVFSAILSVRTASRFGGADPALVERIGEALKSVPVTSEDKVRRCERYDNDRPKLSFAKGKRRVMLFEKMTGFRDGPSVEAAKAMVTGMAARKGWSLAVTDKGGAINPATLRNVDVIIWNNVSGDVLTLTQRKALKNWVERGGGFVAMHGSGGDPVYFWDWYVDQLIGARFTGHPSEPQFQDAKVRIEPSASGIGADLAPGWTMNDEWYSFAKSPRLSGASVIATLDEASYTRVSRFGANIDMGADHPIVWTKCVGKGRSFYSAIGHRPEVYSEPNHLKLFEQAVDWAADRKAKGCGAN
jgi:uncharacterized protein